MAEIQTVEFPPDTKEQADPETLELITALAGAVTTNEWMGDNVPSKAKKDASNRAQFLRRHVAAKLGVEEKQVRSRTRDLSGKKDEKNGQWVWGLRLRAADADGASATNDEG